MSIREIRNTAIKNIKQGWPEFCFISLLSSGIIAFCYTAVILVGKITGVHTATRAVPVFSSLPPYFVIPCVIFVAAVYLSSIPLYYGIRWFYMQASKDFIAPLSSLFAMYSSRKTIRACFLTKAATFLEIIRVIFIPALLTTGLSRFYVYYCEDVKNAIFAVKFILGLMIFALCLCIMTLCADVLFVPYLFTADPYRKPAEMIAESRRLVRENRKSMVKVCLSNCTMLVFSPLIFPLIFIIPLINFIFAITLSKLVDINKDY